MSNKVPYTKPALDYEAQIQKLRDRGLYIENEDKAFHLLRHLSYYRLSGYWYTLLEEPKSEHQFKEGATFNQAFKMYCFDRELRLLILNQIEKIEVSLRANITYECSHNWGAFWLSDSQNFLRETNRRTGTDKYEDTINSILKEIGRSREIFVKNYREKYLEELPPSWISLEVCSMGSLSTVFSLLKNRKRDIAQIYGLNKQVFESWLHALVYIRNVCAHHGRLWNKQLKIQPKIPRRTDLDWISDLSILDTRSQRSVSIQKKTYFVICIIKYFLQTVNPNNSFKEKLEDLFEKYPSIDRNALGYTPNWEEEELWRD